MGTAHALALAARPCASAATFTMPASVPCSYSSLRPAAEGPQMNWEAMLATACSSPTATSTQPSAQIARSRAVCACGKNGAARGQVASGLKTTGEMHAIPDLHVTWLLPMQVPRVVPPYQPHPINQQQQRTSPPHGEASGCSMRWLLGTQRPCSPLQRAGKRRAAGQADRSAHRLATEDVACGTQPQKLGGLTVEFAQQPDLLYRPAA